MALVAGLLLVGAPAPASAQAEPCFPSDAPAYPPETPAAQIQPLQLDFVDSLLPPANPGELNLTGAVPNLEHCGILFSTPITLTPTLSSSTGALRFGLSVPSDFETNAVHHLDVYRQRVLVGAFDFCVRPSGKIEPTTTNCRANSTAGGGTTKPTKTSGGGLARTGAYVDDMIRAALVLLAVGTFVLYLRRRQAQRAVQA